MTVAHLVYHYETLDHSSTLSLSSLPYCVSQQTSSSSLRSNIATMFRSKRQDSGSSMRTDSQPTSPVNSTYDSPASLQTSPTFYSSSDFKYHNTNTPQRTQTLPPFSVANLQNMMSSSRHPTRKVSRPWYTRRALSQIDLALESESRAEGIENAGLDLFEPRPRETIVSRQSTQGSVVLDGIIEVMESAK